LVATARLPEEDARYVEFRGCGVRRDIIGAALLRAVTAVENPTMFPGRARICFEDFWRIRPRLTRSPRRFAMSFEVGDGSVTGLEGFEQEATDRRLSSRSASSERRERLYRVVEIPVQFIRVPPDAKGSTSGPRRRACICAGAMGVNRFVRRLRLRRTE
jgi:hypothetical protein